MEDYSYQLIVEYFEKTISDEGLSELQEWLELHADHQEQFRETLQILEASKLYFRNTEQAGKSWQKISAHMLSEQNANSAIPVKKMNWLAYAATLMLVSASAFWVFNGRTKHVEPISYAEIRNPEGQQSKILLPDSSVVYLAGGSKIRYAKKFRGKKRSVYLDGEAFFDVKHGRRPFVIKSGNITTVVLGTSFNVKAFAVDHKVTVSVNTGKVGILSNVNNENVLLKYLLPNQQLEINTISGLHKTSIVDAGHISAWIKNHFVFYNTPLYEVIASLEHRYGIDIKLMDPESANARITAKFRNMPLKDVMDQLMTLSGLSYKETKKQIFIYEINQGGGKK